MAKLNVLGDIIQIKSDLTEAQIERIKAFDPSMLKLTDENGDEIFGISMGDAHYSKYGIAFSSVDYDGKVFMSTNNPVMDHDNPTVEREQVTKFFAPILSKLIAVEKNVADVESVIDEMEADVSSAITFVD